MPTLVLLRHGLTAMTGPVLAGWTAGLHLDERGQAQAKAVADRLGEVTFAKAVSSPLDRCLDTAGAVLAVQRERGRELALEVDERFGEVRYGDWTGRPLKELAKEPLWKVVQAHPSAAVFPAGEGLAAMQNRVLHAVRAHDAQVRADAGEDAVWLACSHGDVIKSVVADALGTHLDMFQRITVDPCSVTVIRYTDMRPFVVRVNDTGGDVAALLPPKRKGRRRKASADAAVGGGAG